jgi:para-aminobenzoate synthetase / 4-amino-4-deoxychorismate lyase
MKIINELESTPRRIYTGAIGYISPKRKAQFNVAIRTALIDRETQKAEYGIGGGIVWDSTSADEYAEALLKARVLTDPCTEFSLLETMLWTAEEGFFLKEKHIERLLDSADYFGFPVSEAMVEGELERIASSFSQPQRVRLLLDREGRIDIESVPISIGKKNIKIHLADKPVNSNDIFLFHKTTRREVYEFARASHPDCDDVLLYNERNELTEFTIGNLVVELDGELFTPPVECGLLPGTFRSQLVETGKVVEQVIPVLRLKECKKIFRVNSVRQWEPVQIR